MEIQVHLTAQLRDAMGVPTLATELQEGGTLAALLKQLADDYPDTLAQFVMNRDGALLANIIVCVNDQQVVDLASHTLSSGDQVTLLSAISGG